MEDQLWNKSGRQCEFIDKGTWAPGTIVSMPLVLMDSLLEGEGGGVGFCLGC